MIWGPSPADGREGRQPPRLHLSPWPDPTSSRRAGDPSETPHACRWPMVVEEAEAACEPAAVPEQCCSGWSSSASGAGRTAPESRVEASAFQYPDCSAPAAG